MITIETDDEMREAIKTGAEVLGSLKESITMCGEGLIYVQQLALQHQEMIKELENRVKHLEGRVRQLETVKEVSGGSRGNFFDK